MVTLSRPLRASVPMMAPSTTPGFSAGGALAQQERTIAVVASRNLGTSRPMAAAGTMPKSESTE